MHDTRSDDSLVPERWRSLRVESLDGEAWGGPPGDATGLIRACHAARRVPLGELTPAEARVLLGQNIATRFVLTRAIELLRSDPMMDAELYEGDLLLVVCKRVLGGVELHPAGVQALLEVLRNAAVRLATTSDGPPALRLVVEQARDTLRHDGAA